MKIMIISQYALDQHQTASASEAQGMELTLVLCYTPERRVKAIEGNDVLQYASIDN